MKKQLVLTLSGLLVVGCTSLKGGENYATLADMFVWGEDDTEVVETPNGVKVSYKEKLPSQNSDNKTKKYNNYQYNDNIDIKYVDVEKETHDNEPSENEKDVIVKEVIIETDTPNENTQTYTLTKRSERYKHIEDKVSPNVYAILASRVVNKFLTDMPAIFATEENPSLYIEETVYGDRFLPTTPNVVDATTKEIIIGSKMIDIVNDPNKATNILKGRISNINTPEVPVFKYEIGLYDNSNKLIDKWSDTIRQVQNDDGSWW